MAASAPIALKEALQVGCRTSLSVQNGLHGHTHLSAFWTFPQTFVVFRRAAIQYVSAYGHRWCLHVVFAALSPIAGPRLLEDWTSPC